MKTSSNIKLKLKIGFGVLTFIISIVAIFIAFALSVGVLLDILLKSAFYLALLLGPLLFIGLFWLLVMLFSERRKKWITLFVGITFSFFGIFDLTVKSLSSSRSIPLIKFASNDAPDHALVEYERPLTTSVLYDNEAYFRTCDTLGYVPAKNRAIKSSEIRNGDTIFDVQYTINNLGLRVSPPYRSEENTRSILFFGCSVTFGYGLADQETFPYRVGVKTNGKYKVFNFAFNGYATHQMVAGLESTFVESRVDITPEHIFYLATPLHLEWMQNQKNWGRHDPMYSLNETNALNYEGHFDDLPSEKLKSLLFDFRQNYQELKLRSYTIQLIDPIEDVYYKHYTKKEQDLFIALIKRARALVAEKYPDAKFHIIYWPMNPTAEHRIIQLLNHNNFDYHLISEAIPNYNDDFQNYCIDYPADAHPNALANDLISDFIVNHIINKNEAQL